MLRHDDDNAVDDPDALWRPGGTKQWTRPAEPVDTDRTAHGPTTHDQPSSTSNLRRIGLASAAALLVACTATVAVLALGATLTPSIAPTPAALPDTIAPVWSVEGPEFVSAADFGGDAELVVAILDDGQPDARAQLLVIDGATGMPRWRAPVSLQPSQVNIAATTAEAVVVSVRRGIGNEDLIAFDAQSGRTLWERQSPTGARFTTIEATATLVQVDVLRARGETSVIDLESGATVVGFRGRIERVDQRGTIEYVSTGGDFVAVDLEDGEARSETITTGVGAADRATRVGEYAIVARADGSLDAAHITTGVHRRLDTGSAAPSQITATGPATALLVTRNRLMGITVSDGEFGIEWSRDVRTESVGTSGSDAVVLAGPLDPGLDAGFSVIDGVTGVDRTRTVIPNSGATAIVGANGVVVRASDHLGGPMSGFGFDGQPKWTLDVPSVKRFGDGRVVALATDPTSGFVITAYGR